MDIDQKVGLLCARTTMPVGNATDYALSNLEILVKLS